MSRSRRPAWQWTTLFLSVALAVSLGATIYFATSSLPFLATSPSSDPTFGALNACLHHAVPSRTGFTVARDARAAAVWSTTVVAVCRLDGDRARDTSWPISGVTVGAFDGEGSVWVVSQPGGLTSTLLRLDPSGPTPFGEASATDLVGTNTGLVMLESSGRLVALTHAGVVTAALELPPVAKSRLVSSADGARIAVVGSGALSVFDAQTLAVHRHEAPCQIDQLWWLRSGHRVLVSCRTDDLNLIVDTETGTHEVAPRARRPPSVLVGATGPYVEPCDVLPCTSEPPE